MQYEPGAHEVSAREISVDVRMQYLAYPKGVVEVRESRVDRTVEDWDDDGVWSVFVYLANGHRLVFLPDEPVVVYL